MSQAVVDSSPMAEANVVVAVFALVIRGSAEAGATGKFAEVGSVPSLTAPACVLPAGKSLKGVGEGGRQKERGKEREREKGGGGGGISKVFPSHWQLLAPSYLKPLCAMPVHSPKV